MKRWGIWILVIASISLNVYHFAKDYWVGMYTPNERDQIILGEMAQLVVESEDYKKLAESEKIYAITTMVDRNKGGRFPFHYNVIVKTNKESYIFSCQDETCGAMGIEGWMYSRYSENGPVLPLK